MKYLLGLINMMHHAPTKLNQFVIGMWFHITIYFRKYTCHICTVCANSSEKWSKLFLMWRLCWVSNKLFSATPLESQTTYTQWRHKSKISEKLGRCGRKNMLWPYLKIWDWDWIFDRAVKAIASLGVRSPWYSVLQLYLQRRLFLTLKCLILEEHSLTIRHCQRH